MEFSYGEAGLETFAFKQSSLAKKLQCYYGGFRKELPPAAAAAIQGTRRWPNIYLGTVGGSESESLLPEQKLFPATPAMEQWLEDLDTRVVGWEMLTG